ncbi:hypothetical protein [Bacillus thuringiensis]|uniref:hypothetical protein n=1 Tax=Bacillus thuringiensis TaxID=1428 RepID=UPI001873606C|nr:hypothetical protein [Bacillus thuringiensis]MBE5096899.1 hypothetical protein [Bacillus thuringiensis]
MHNNRKRNVIKERIRQEKERRERLIAEEEEQYDDIHENQVSEKFQQDFSEQTLKQSENRGEIEENEASNSNPVLDWITTIQKQASTSENDLKIEEAREGEEVEVRRKAEESRKRREAEVRRKAEEEARKREEAKALRRAEEEARKQAEAEALRRAEEEARKQVEAQRKEEEKKLEEVRTRRLEEERKIKEAQKRQKIVVAKRESESDERNLPNETKFEQEEKVAIDKKGILNNMKKYKYAIIGVASIVLLVVAGFAFSNMKNSQAASANNVNSLEVNANLISGLRLSAVQKYQDAALEFDKVDYKKLGKEDKKAVLFTYLLSGKAQKAIDLEQDFAESVVSYYIAVDNLKKVKELKIKNPIINFEIAALDNKHEEVINLRDQVPLDGRREGIIVNSYLKLNKSEEAKKFAQKVGNKDLLEKINNSTPNSSATSVATISAG